MAQPQLHYFHSSQRYIVKTQQASRYPRFYLHF